MSQQPRTKIPAFTLSQLAHFDRCLYQADIQAGLIKHGVDPALAASMMSIVSARRQRGAHTGVMFLYQEWITDLTVTTAIENMVAEFVGPVPAPTMTRESKLLAVAKQLIFYKTAILAKDFAPSSISLLLLFHETEVAIAEAEGSHPS